MDDVYRSAHSKSRYIIRYQRYLNDTSFNFGCITSNNIVHYINGTQRNLYNGSSGGTTLPNGGVTAAQGSGLETNSLQSTSTGNYVLFTDPGNLDYTLQESSPARNIALMAVIPTKDLRNYTRDQVSSDLGAYDMNGVAPVLPESILTVSVGGVLKNSAFGVQESTQVVFGNNSTNTITTTLEILNSSNTVIASTTTFPYSFTFVTIGVYRLRMISVNNDGSDTLDLPNYVTVDVLPTPLFSVVSAPVLINGEGATASFSDSSTPGVTVNGAIISKVWDVVDSLSNSLYQSNTTPFVLAGSNVPQGTYGLKLTVSNIVGSASLTISNSVRINRTPVVNVSIPNQVGTRLTPFSYTIPENAFSDGSDVPTYSIASGPDWLSLTGATLSGTPPLAGSSTVSIRATDPDGLSAQSSFGLNIGSGQPPLVVTQPGNKAIPVGSQFFYKIRETLFYSPSPFTISIIQKPSWMDYIDAELTLIGEPTSDDVGTSQVVIRADDGFTQADCTFSIEVFNQLQLNSVNNGDSLSGVRSKINSLISFVNKIR